MGPVEPKSSRVCQLLDMQVSALLDSVEPGHATAAQQRGHELVEVGQKSRQAIDSPDDASVPQTQTHEETQQIQGQARGSEANRNTPRGMASFTRPLYRPLDRSRTR